MAKIILVPHYDIRLVFEKVRPLLEKSVAKSHGEMDAQDIYMKLLNGQFQLWIASENGIKAACITEVMDYPKKRVLRIVSISGVDMKSWGHDGDKALTDFAKKIGATHMDCLGRKGWAKTLEEYGYSPGYTHMIKEV